MAVLTYTATGNKATTAAKLDKAIFDVKVESHELLKQAYVTYLANGRDNLARTKRRGEVRGGGRKPWRQKGTGRARFGSSRNPIWRGGGVAFGPTGSETYTHKLNLKAKRQALRQALSIANAEGKIAVIDSFTSKDGKTAPIIKLLEKINAKGNILLVVNDKDNLIERATRNIPSLKLVQGGYLNVFDIVNADNIIVTQKALEIIHDWLGVKAAKAKAKETQK